MDSLTAADNRLQLPSESQSLTTDQRLLAELSIESRVAWQLTEIYWLAVSHRPEPYNIR